ncbi:MAG: DUF2971 domain-containing protein [Bacillota bacterium]|nr:DUF2971 domain-containing protein [Bacillota bacterium]
MGTGFYDNENKGMYLINTLEESLEREYKIKMKTNGILYHYTNLLALYAIIDTGIFWGTRSEFLNDTSELKYIKTVIENVTSQICEEDSRFPFKQSIFRNLEGIYFNMHHRSKCYVLSLTDVSDLITNWSSYSQFDGYNIGLDSEHLHQILEYRYRDAFISGFVIYDEDIQEEIIREEFLKYFHIWESISDRSEEDLDIITDKFMFRILIYSYFFKHPSFKQEEEYRIAFFPEAFPEARKTDVKFRTSKGVIMPFIELNFKEITGDKTKLPLKEIWIGPTNKMDNAFLGLDTFLNSLGYDTESTEGTQIKTSVIPLRF